MCCIREDNFIKGENHFAYALTIIKSISYNFAHLLFLRIFHRSLLAAYISNLVSPPYHLLLMPGTALYHDFPSCNFMFKHSGVISVISKYIPMLFLHETARKLFIRLQTVNISCKNQAKWTPTELLLSCIPKISTALHCHLTWGAEWQRKVPCGDSLDQMELKYPCKFYQHYDHINPFIESLHEP